MIFDTHLHLVDRARLTYPWLGGVPALDRDWDFASYSAQAARLADTQVGGLDLWDTGFAQAGVEALHVAGRPVLARRLVAQLGQLQAPGADLDLADLALAPVGLKVSIGDRLSAIREAVRQSGMSGVDLETLLGERRDRSFIAVTFLALLELAKRREVEVVQDTLWGPIIITESAPESVPA